MSQFGETKIDDRGHAGKWINNNIARLYIAVFYAILMKAEYSLVDELSEDTVKSSVQ